MTEAIDARRPARRDCQISTSWPMNSRISVSASIIVATALVSGVTPRLTWPKMYSGSVDEPGPDVKVVIT